MALDKELSIKFWYLMKKQMLGNLKKHMMIITIFSEQEIVTPCQKLICLNFGNFVKIKDNKQYENISFFFLGHIEDDNHCQYSNPFCNCHGSTCSSSLMTVLNSVLMCVEQKLQGNREPRYQGSSSDSYQRLLLFTIVRGSRLNPMICDIYSLN